MGTIDWRLRGICSRAGEQRPADFEQLELGTSRSDSGILCDRVDVPVSQPFPGARTDPVDPRRNIGVGPGRDQYRGQPRGACHRDHAASRSPGRARADPAPNWCCMSSRDPGARIAATATSAVSTPCWISVWATPRCSIPCAQRAAAGASRPRRISRWRGTANIVRSTLAGAERRRFQFLRQLCVWLARLSAGRCSVAVDSQARGS